MAANMCKWNLYKMCSKVLCDRLTCLTWCKENGLLPSMKTCPEGHIIVMTEQEIRKAQFTSGNLQCTEKHHCGEDLTVIWWTASWFEKSKFILETTLMMSYCYSRGLTSTIAVEECSFTTDTISLEDVVKYYHFCRELVADYILKYQDLSGKLGGKEKVITIYESKFDLRKYNRSKIEEGTHVICIVEKNTKRFRVICPLNKRDHESLLEIIEENVVEGSTVVTEECSEYRELSKNYTFLPQTVKSDILVNLKNCHRREEDTNISKEIKGASTNKAVGDELIEYLWRHEMKHNKQDSFECFLEIIRSYFTF